MLVFLLVLFLLFLKKCHQPKNAITVENIDYAFGANFDQKHYFLTETYEPLAHHLPENKLPKSISLLQYAPNRLHQGRQGSCVGWACSYVAHTVLYAAANRRAPNSVAFSPAFCFNQVAGSDCEGAFLKEALEVLCTVGNLSLRQFNYDEQTCRIKPTPEEIKQAQRFKIGGFYRLTQGVNSNKPDIHSIRQHLAKGVPVVAGIQVGGTFLHQMHSRSMWVPTQQDYEKEAFFGHAMAIVGYDDELDGGAFQLVNSWGSDWGQSGVTWIAYRDFLHFSEEVYSFFPEDTNSKSDRKKLAASVQIMDVETGNSIPMRQLSNGIFQVNEPIWENQQFKILTKNDVACFTYLFMKKDGGDCEVLFPYDKNHSAYCGITGARIFPKKQNLRSENEHKYMNFAVVFSKRALNWENVNNLINASRQVSFLAKVQEVLANEQVLEMAFSDGEAIRFETELGGRNAVAMVIQL